MGITGQRNRTRVGAIGAALVLTLGLAGCGARDEANGANDPGITDTEVVLGQSIPFSGNLSIFAPNSKAAQAVFKRVNAEGGVAMGDGVTRKIRLIALDDGYDPSRTLANAKKLVERDEVFSLYAIFGTPSNNAIVNYTTSKKIPQLVSVIGSSTFGADPETTPYAMGINAPYATEAAIYAKRAEKSNPTAKIAVLYQGDDQGEDFLKGLDAAVEGTGMKIVAKQSFAPTDTTVESQVVNLASSGADVFLNLTTPKFGAQAIKTMIASDWKPEMYLPAFGVAVIQLLTPAELQTVSGIHAGLVTRDPGQEGWATDPAVVDYLKTMKEYGDGSFDPLDRTAIFGAVSAQTMIEILKGTKKPTRAAMMDAARSMDFTVPMLADGLALHTSADDPFALEGLVINTLVDGRWTPDEVVDFDGKTNR